VFRIILDVMIAGCRGVVACLCLFVGLWKKSLKKNHMKKNCCNHNIFKKKTTKLNSQPA
jgi:hypothetical protein